MLRNCGGLNRRVEERCEGLARQGRLLQARGADWELPWNLGILADAYRKAGQPEEGLHVLAEALDLEALDLLNKFEGRDAESELYRIQGELVLQEKAQDPKSEEEAEACFQHAIDIARNQSAKLLELRAVMSLARLWQQQGK